MSEKDLNLVDAIQIALEAEKRMAALYREAAESAPHAALERLFGGLARFEQYHYDKVTELAARLQKEGKYIVYEASAISIPAQSEIEFSAGAAEALEAKRLSLMDVLTVAQDTEKQADKHYSALAAQTSDPDGKAMFEKLAKEEQSHLKLLTGVYWALNDRGVLAWPKL
ncbi:MAG: ferritin family protein [Anaerolineae bacterium]|nr:ferritin family protein [Anaerolineae bacterium]